MNATSHNIEEAVRTSAQVFGVPRVHKIDPQSDLFFDNSGSLNQLTASTTKPTLLNQTVSSGAPVGDHRQRCVEWTGAEGADDYLYVVWEVPEDYSEEADAFALVGWGWKHDLTGSATANDDAELVCTAFILKNDSETVGSLNGYAVTRAGSTGNYVIPTDSDTADWQRFAFDFSHKITNGSANRVRLTAGDTVIFRLDLNEDIGTNLSYYIKNLAVHYRGSLCVWNKDSRGEFPVSTGQLDVPTAR